MTTASVTYDQFKSDTLQRIKAAIEERVGAPLNRKTHRYLDRNISNTIADFVKLNTWKLLAANPEAREAAVERLIKAVM